MDDIKKIAKKVKELEKRVDKFKIDIEDLYKLVLGKKESNIKCHSCNYEWVTRSKKMLISCPHCNSKVKNPNSSP